MPLYELATEERIAGINSVLRNLKAGCIRKVFLSKEADPALLKEITRAAEAGGVPIEWAEDSMQLGRACAIARKTAAAALLKK
ncbi:MAG: ribosomal L7Ae/L30e/S12e/Gadd45 family protein [Synergistaceae bacterium]|nr:ribosomal L7Ae/L30e/S12e/Gadd45 family protein [Synergistaceae bacterium]